MCTLHRVAAAADAGFVSDAVGRSVAVAAAAVEAIVHACRDRRCDDEAWAGPILFNGAAAVVVVAEAVCDADCV